MTLIRLILIVLLIIVVLSLEDNIINKDLYKVLGITKDAAINDIKKAYRKLAQVHHPDKAKGPDKQLHEALFREIAEAYEILSDSNQRQEYDDRRMDKSNQKRYEQDIYKQQQEYQRQYQQQQEKYQEYQRYMQKQYEAYEQQQRQQYEQQQFFDDLLHDFYQSSFFQPEIIGSILPAGEVIFPYVPIMTSEDRSHFAMLDVHCSLGIYRGNVDDVVRHLIRGLTPDLTSLAVCCGSHINCIDKHNSKSSPQVSIWPTHDIIDVARRNFQSRFVAIEIFFSTRTTLFLNLYESKIADRFQKVIRGKLKPPNIGPFLGTFPSTIVNKTLVNGK